MDIVKSITDLTRSTTGERQSRPVPLYQALSGAVDAYHRVVRERGGQDEWAMRHKARIEKLVREHLPSGSGFDNGTRIAITPSRKNKLVFDTSFHHMDDNGHYAGWTDHTVTVVPDLHSGFDMRISGPNRDRIKDEIYEAFDHSLRTLVTE